MLDLSGGYGETPDTYRQALNFIFGEYIVQSTPRQFKNHHSLIWQRVLRCTPKKPPLPH